MANHHLDIKPVERDCICAVFSSIDGVEVRENLHIQQCNDAYREKFFGTWTATRGAFYEDNPPVVDGSMN